MALARDIRSACEDDSAGENARQRGLRARVARTLADEHGISIVFAMILLVVLLIVGGIIVSYAYSGYQRAQQDRADQQAYYNVQSAADLVHGEFKGRAKNDGSWVAKLMKAAEDKTPKEGDNGSRLRDGGEPVDWNLHVAVSNSGSNGSASSSNGAASQSTDSSSSNAPSFADVTIRVQHSAGKSYNVTCFEKDQVNSDGAITGVAYGFTASMDPSTNNSAIDASDEIQVVGQ